MVKKPAASGVVGRGLRLSWLGLSLTGSYIGYQAQNLIFGEAKRQQRQQTFQLRASRRVREELGSLKGAAMKLGQLLSLQGHALSPEALEELSHLQMNAPGMHRSLARAQFKGALGKYPEDVFAEFEAEPFAAASLGQVHRAVTKKGEKVAVKIQYPAIRSAIENDLKLLRSATLPAQISGHFPAGIVDEVQRGFMEETDYVQEAKNIELFAANLSRFDYVRIPKVHWDLSSDRVLTMGFIEGEPAANFLKRKPVAEVLDRIGERLVELYYFQLVHMKALHADYHPGNFLFRPGRRNWFSGFRLCKTNFIRCWRCHPILH